jgi:hypothetical protein
MVRSFLRSVSVQLISVHSRECEREYSLGNDLNLTSNEIHRRFDRSEAIRVIISVLLIDIHRSSTNLLSMEGLIEELAEVREELLSESDPCSRSRANEIVGKGDRGVETQRNPFR